MPDYADGIKRDVAETKFLIHDLRVERFINEVIHFHVTLNTDLEIYGIEQAQVLHGADLQVLKETAVTLRKALQDYSNAVKSFSPDKTILLLGKRYIDTIYSMCELILNPLWGRMDKVLAFLPADSKSVQARTHYRNCINWIQGVRLRIEHFRVELRAEEVYEEFDVGPEIERFTLDVVNGYVREKSLGRVEIELDQLDSATIGGNLPRFRRMYFNLVMNAVDAMSNREVGLLNVSATVQGERVVLSVRDNGSGMPPEKITELLTDKETLDGELHSLGFVFVRQTIDEFKGELSVESEVGKGTTITVAFPCLGSAQAAAEPTSANPEGSSVAIAQPASPPPTVADGPPPGSASSGSAQVAATPEPPASLEDRERSCGRIIYHDYEISEAQFPGSIFAISITEDGKLDLFTHKPYERYYSITHEDLTPMFFEATMRGRIDEDEEKQPVVTLKAPQSLPEYFELKEVPGDQRSHEKYIEMVRDEYVRIARKLVETGMPPQIGVLVDSLKKFFPENGDLVESEPIPLELLAKQALTTEKNG
jgi:hypothetical protein